MMVSVHSLDTHRLCVPREASSDTHPPLSVLCGLSGQLLVRAGSTLVRVVPFCPLLGRRHLGHTHIPRAKHETYNREGIHQHRFME